MYEKLKNLNSWYTRIIGLDEVRVYQERVTSIQEQLLQTQEKRRTVGRQLTDVRQKSLELQDQIHKVKRQENLERFLDLMKQETEILKLENSISKTFQDYDQTERELFTAFSNAIRDSHEKQRAQVEYTKYFGLILSITGSFLAFVYTTVKKHDLKVFIEEKLETIDKRSEPVILDLVQANQKTVEEISENRDSLNEVIRVLTFLEKKIDAKIDNVVDGDPVYSQTVHNSDENKVDLYKVLGVIYIAYVVLKMFSG